VCVCVFIRMHNFYSSRDMKLCGLYRWDSIDSSFSLHKPVISDIRGPLEKFVH
jgi:hypothetical protein